MSTEHAAFLSFHDEYLKVMDRSYATGETAEMLPLLGPDYHGYFGTAKEDRAAFYDLADALEGIGQTAQACPGLRHGYENRSVLMPNPEHAIVFYKKSMDMGSRVVHAFILEVWRQMDGRWRLVRDTVEHG